MNESNLLALCTLLRADTLVPHELRSLLSRFGSAELLAQASADTLRQLGLGDRTARFLAETASKGDPEAEASRLAKHGVTMIAEDDPLYPPLLAEIPDAPPVLFVRGNATMLAAPHALTVIGSRALTPYGRQATRALLAPCVRAGATVVSGLAYGADAAAHEVALQERGITIAVLASGVDRPCVGPRANLPLSERIIESGGCLVSEYPPGLRADKRRFPQRNRLLAGLARVTLAVEAAEKSGSLITCRYALEFGREVLALPGPINSPTSAGTNLLIASGARPALSPGDIINSLKLVQAVVTKPKLPTDPTEAAVLSALARETLTADALADRTELPIRQVLTALATLETVARIEAVGDRWQAAAR